jgi:hypothetical protein
MSELKNHSDAKLGAKIFSSKSILTGSHFLELPRYFVSSVDIDHSAIFNYVQTKDIKLASDQLRIELCRPNEPKDHGVLFVGFYFGSF